MAPPKDKCDRHEDQIKELAEVRMQVETMQKQQDKLTEVLDKLNDKISELDKRIMMFGGLFGTSGAIIVALISNLDKIKGLFT